VALTPEGVQRVVAAVLATWVEPEFRRRAEAGTLPADFKLTAYQLILDADAVPTEVRLNEEVRAFVRWPSRREKALFDVRLGDDSIEVPEIILTDGDPDAGHITSIATGDGWLTSIDVRPNAGEAARHASAAREFLDAAGGSLATGNMRAFSDNLFSACELMAKTYLLTVPGVQFGKSHGTIASRFNLERKAGRVHDSFSKLLNRLTDLRDSGRYLRGDFDLGPDEARSMMIAAEQMYRSLDDVVPKRARSKRRD
jgi:uncharacterized protein (UPF0332 family)